jgi:hypothetical protein
VHPDSDSVHLDIDRGHLVEYRVHPDIDRDHLVKFRLQPADNRLLPDGIRLLPES